MCLQARPQSQFVLAEAGRYPLGMSAAVFIPKYWNLVVVVVDTERLVMKALLASAALLQKLAPTNPTSTCKPQVGHVASMNNLRLTCLKTQS